MEKWSCKCGIVIYDGKLKVDFRKMFNCEDCILKTAIEYNLNRNVNDKTKKID